MASQSAVDNILTSMSRLPSNLADPSNSSGPASRFTSHSPTHSHSRSGSNNPLNHLSPSAASDAKALFLTLHFLFPHDFLPALDLLDRGLVTQLVPRKLSSSAAIHDTTTASPPDTKEPSEIGNAVFYIQSASAITDSHTRHTTSATSASSTLGPSRSTVEPQGHFRNALPTKGKGSATQTFYEVRIDSWNCSCAAFAVSAFTYLLKEDTLPSTTRRTADHNEQYAGNEVHEVNAVAEARAINQSDEEQTTYKFGGTLTQHSPSMGVPVCKHILAAVMAKAAPTMFVDGIHVDVHRHVDTDEMAGWGGGWGDEG